MNIGLPLRGKQFGRLIAIRRTVRSYWLCKCSCGQFKEVQRKHLIGGKTNSCGCLQGEHLLRHGMYKSREYQSWANMIARCSRSSSPNYKWYGGRGIGICRRWRKSFVKFYEDMGPRPKGKTLDRADGNDHYYKGNCRWATQKEQIANQRRA